MKQARKSLLVLAAVLAVSLGGCSGTVAPDVVLHDFSIYRGVNAKANNGNASLSPAQFNFNPNLSTFDNPALAPVQRPCNYRFVATGLPNDPPAIGDAGNVQGLPGYTARFDNVPPGHWSIIAPANTPPAAARATISAFAQANRHGNLEPHPPCH